MNEALSKKEVIVQRIEAIAPLLVTLFGIINAFLQYKNLPCIEIGDAQITQVVNEIAAMAGSFYIWWFNNNMTKKAQLNQKVLNGLKDGAISEQQVESILPEQVVVK